MKTHAGELGAASATGTRVAAPGLAHVPQLLNDVHLRPLFCDRVRQEMQGRPRELRTLGDVVRRCALELAPACQVRASHAASYDVLECWPRRRLCVVTGHFAHMQLLAVRAQHIGNNDAWIRRRGALLRQLLTARASKFGATLGVKSAYAACGEAKHLHGPLLIEDLAVTAGLRARPFAHSAAA